MNVEIGTEADNSQKRNTKMEFSMQCRVKKNKNLLKPPIISGVF